MKNEVTKSCENSGIEFVGTKRSKYAPEVAKIRNEAFRYNWLKEYELIAVYVRNEGGYTTTAEFVSKVREVRKDSVLVAKLVSAAFVPPADELPDSFYY